MFQSRDIEWLNGLKNKKTNYMLPTVDLLQPLKHT